MWPTFYIPNVLAIGTSQLRAYACGRRTGFITNTDLTYDTGAAAIGSLEIACLSWLYTTGAAGDENITIPVDSTGWRVLYDESNPASLNNASRVDQCILWRIKQSGDLPLDVTFSGRQVVLTYSLYAFADVDQADPFGLAARSNVAGAGYGRHVVPMDLRIGAAGNLLLSFVPYGYVNDKLREWPTSEDAEFLNRCYAAQDTSPTNYYTSRLVWEPATATQANNHVLYSESSTGWTANLVTVVAGPTSTYSTETQFTANWGRFSHTASTGEHYVYQDVTLEAGKTYVFWGHIARQATVPAFLGYIKPDNSKHGAIQGASDDSTMQYVGTEIDSSDYFWFQGQLNGFSSNRSASLFGIYINPTETGTYRLMYGTTLSSSSDFSCVGSTSYTTGVHFLACTEVPSKFHLPAYVKTTSATVTGGEGVFSMTQDLSGTSGQTIGRGLTLELRSTGAAHQQAYLMQPWSAGFPSGVLTDDRLSWSTTEQFYYYQLDASYTVACSRINYAGGGNGNLKYYFEVTHDTYGTTSASQYIAFGVTFGSGAAHNTPDGETAYQYGDLPGEFSYNSNGKFGDDGTFTAVDGTKAWAAGDVLGCAVDLDGLTVKFYKNGTEVKSCTIPTYYSTQAVQPHLTILGANLSTSNFIMTANFSGPFSSKPTGYVAWDWANEVA